MSPGPAATKLLFVGGQSSWLLAYQSMTIACPDCGTLQELPSLPRRSRGVCPICRKHLELTSGRSVTAALGCALGTFLLLFPANFAPLMRVSMMGTTRSSWLFSGVIALWKEHWFLLSVLICAFTVVLPFVRFGLLSLVLGMIRMGRRRHWLGRAFRWAVWLDIWAMPDVLLVAVFVGYRRLEVNLGVNFGWGGYCFIVAALLSMLSRASLDRRTVWRAIEDDHPLPEGAPALSCTTCEMVLPLESEGDKCPRCGARLVTRKLNALPRAMALNLAAFILYWLANIYPMNISIEMGHRVEYRIIDGIRALFEAGLAPLGSLSSAPV